MMKMFINEKKLSDQTDIFIAFLSVELLSCTFKQ